MTPVFLETSFMDVVWWMLMVFVWTMVLFMFISVFSDIFRRQDHSGWAKVSWILVIVLLPFLGILIYVLLRPPTATLEQDMAIIEQQRRMAGYSATNEIAQAQQLLQSGAITQAEFDAIKTRALG